MSWTGRDITRPAWAGCRASYDGAPADEKNYAGREKQCLAERADPAK